MNTELRQALEQFQTASLTLFQTFAAAFMASWRRVAAMIARLAALIKIPIVHRQRRTDWRHWRLRKWNRKAVRI